MAVNTKNTGIKRILADVRELEKHPSSRYHATPLEDNMFEWHFTIRGPSGSDFDGGMYHGRILLPAEYPFKPPNIIFLTKNGRFEVGTKICLSISAYHEESWQPAWGVRTMLEAIISFLPSEGAGAIGALDWSKEERQKLAVESHHYSCPICGKINELLADDSPDNEKVDDEIAQQIAQLGFTNASPGPSASKPSTREGTASVLSMESPEKSSNSSSKDSTYLQNESISKELFTEEESADVDTVDLSQHLPLEETTNLENPEQVAISDDAVTRNVLSVATVNDTDIKINTTDQSQPSLSSNTTDTDTATASTSVQHIETLINEPAVEVAAAGRQSPKYDIVDGFLVSMIFGMSLVLAILIIKKILKYIGDVGGSNTPQSLSTEF